MHLISLLGLSALLANTVNASPATHRAIVSCEVNLTPYSSHNDQYQVKTAIVDGQALPDGIYQMCLGLNQVITSRSDNPGSPLQLLPPGKGSQKSRYDSENGSYTFRLVSSNSFITSEYVQPGSLVKLGDAMNFVLLPSTESDAPNSFLVSPAGDVPPLAIAKSLLPVYPPPVAFLPFNYPTLSTVTFHPD